MTAFVTDSETHSDSLSDNALIVAGPTDRERLAAVIAHGGTLFAWFLAPLAVYLLKRGESRWVEHHALQSLLWSLAGTGLSIVTCGLAIPVFLAWHILATVRILRGEEYEYPVVGDFARGLLRS
jgi:uncharacterized Tic20 family protein